MTDKPLITALDHLIIAVEDLDDATATYQRLLGRPPSWRGAHPGAGTANTLFRLENIYLELLSPVAEGANADQLKAQMEKTGGDGLVGMALQTDNIEACATRLREKGIEVLDPVEGEGRDEATGKVRRWKNLFLPMSATGGVFVFLIEHQGPDILSVSEPALPGAAIDRLDHVVINTPDPEGAIAFFGDTLGIRLALDQTKEEWGVRQLFFRVAKTTLEVVTGLDETKRPKKARLWGVAYDCHDIEKVHARLTSENVAVSELRKGRKPGTTVATIKPPTGGVPTLLIAHGSP